jgi:hypothetical protein
VEPTPDREGRAVGKDAVARYMPKPPERPRPSAVADVEDVRSQPPRRDDRPIDFLTVPTTTFGMIYVFFVLSLQRWRILHINVTTQPHAAWTAQQVVEALDRMLRPSSG